MPAIDEPFNIQNGQDGDADAVMANFGTIVDVINGGLELGSNVKAAAPSAPIAGNASTPGTSVSALRADSQFTVQGFENSASDPASGNFLGRSYFNTVSNKMRMCILTAGSGTWVTTGNPAAADLVLHAANHTDGGIDQLATGAVAQRNMKARTLHSATLGSDHIGISSSSFSTIIDMNVDTSGTSQTLGVYVSMIFVAGAASAGHNAAFRVVDVTDSNTTIYCSGEVQCDLNRQTQISGFFYYNTPNADARVLRVQAGVTTGGDCNVRAQGGFNTETLNTPTITAVVL